MTLGDRFETTDRKIKLCRPMVEMIDDAKSKNRIKKQFIEHSFLTVAVGTGVSYLSETLLLVFCLLYTKFNLVRDLVLGLLVLLIQY